MMPKLLEINPLRKNLYAPGSHIPVIMEDEEKELPNIYYVLAWNFKDEILKRIKITRRWNRILFPYRS